MTHDPNEKLCQFVEMDERDYELNCAFYAPPDCQCKLIAKVREDERGNNFTPDDFSNAMTEPYQRGLDAARKAVLGAKAIDVAYGRGLDEPAQFVWLNNALAAIDALREKSND
jgi:hypothetical protein